MRAERVMVEMILMKAVDGVVVFKLERPFFEVIQ